MDWTKSYTMVKETLSERRFRHTLGVMDLAEKLAMNYNVEIEKARLAALLHDCARGWPEWQLLKKAEDFAIVVTEIDRSQPELLHAPIAAELARREHGVSDPAVVEAIRWHTTGHEQMDDLAKIIYVADSLELGREYPGVDRLRQEMYTGLDQICLSVLNHTLSYLLETDKLIHPQSIRARNELLLQRK